MKATELRIGNLIFQSGQITTIENISRSINDWERVNNKRLFDCTPIPLTEEWLLKFGFVKKEIGYSKLTEIKECFSISFGKHTSINAIKFNNEVKYVHQLQNIYFALTGEELTLKP